MEAKHCPYGRYSQAQNRNSCYWKGTATLCDHDINDPVDWQQCEDYADHYLTQHLPLPHQCPLLMECHKNPEGHEDSLANEKGCPCGEIDPLRLCIQPTYDYRGCETFSKWYWNDIKKKKQQ